MREEIQEQELHLRDYLKTVLKRRYIVGACFAVVFLATLVVTFSTTPLYMATAKILVEKSEPSNLATLTFYYVPYDPDFYETQYQLLRSPAVAEKVVTMLSLDKSYQTYFGGTSGLFGGIRKSFSSLFGLVSRKPGAAPQKTDPGGESLQYRLARTISSGIIISPVKNTKLVNVSYMSPSAQLATEIVNAVPKAYADYLLETKMSSSKHMMRWMEEKAEEERERLQKSEKMLQEYTKEKDIVTLENKIQILPQKLSDVGGRLAEAEAKRKERETLYAKVKNLSKSPEKAEAIPAIASDPTFQALKTQEMKTEQNIMELSKKYGQKHPVMVSALGDLKIIKDREAQEISRIIESIKNDYELAKANEDALRQMASETKSATLSLNEKFVQYGVLKREAETNKELFDAIMKKIKERGFSQDVRAVDVSVVEKADTPRSPVKPRKLYNILIGLLMGLAGGVGLAFFVEYLDNTVKTPADVEAKLGAPVLGIVNLLKEKDRRIEELVQKEPQSAFAESYRVIRTALLLSSSEKPLKNILISSTSPGEGKTATAVNLALTIARAEHSVLLIDGDLRRPRVHKIFGFDNSKGLSTYLAGASEVSIQSRNSSEGLSIITSGPIPPNPSELLSSSRMQSLMKMLNAKFDVVIWDSAPLMTVSDSMVLSKIVDGTILVAKAGSTTFEDVRRGMKSLKDMEAPFLGLIINALDIKKEDYYYNRYYHYSYGSYTKEKR